MLYCYVILCYNLLQQTILNRIVRKAGIFLYHVEEQNVQKKYITRQNE